MGGEIFTDDEIIALLRREAMFAKRLRGDYANPLSKRLAEGWYPSRPDDYAPLGHVHDRHVLINVREYERSLVRMADLIELLTGTLPD